MPFELSFRSNCINTRFHISIVVSHHEETITTRQAAGLGALMDLTDNDLLDLLLCRNEPRGEIDTDEVHEVLAMMRAAPRGAGRLPPNVQN